MISRVWFLRLQCRESTKILDSNTKPHQVYRLSWDILLVLLDLHTWMLGPRCQIVSGLVMRGAVGASASVDFYQNLQRFEMRHSVLEAHTSGVLDLT